MRNKRYIRKFICIVTVLGLLAGCGYSDPVAETQSSEEEEFTTLGLTPEFDYELPQSLPNILVDQVGYAQGSSKTAVFLGEQLPDAFRIVNADTGRTVYTGVIEAKGFDEQTEAFISYGEFTDFDTVGTYYIQADRIGQSYPFRIARQPYNELFQVVQKQYYYNRCGVTLSQEHAGEAAHNACHTKEAQTQDEADVKMDVSGGWHVDENGKRDVVKGCATVNYLLLAYELYAESFTDDIGIPESGNEIPDILDEVKYEIDWLLKMQDAKSGAVYASVNSVDHMGSSYILYVDAVTMEATIQFAAAMAKFSYIYQNYDREFATICIKASDRAYRYAGKYIDDVSPEAYFHASTELYRATGSYGYHEVIKRYLAEHPDPDMKNDFIFLGSVTYLSTKQRVDTNLCSQVIKVLMQDVEQVSYNSKNSKLLVNADKRQENNEELLDDIVRLAVVDHIITNHEYTNVLENHMHYLLGRNILSVSYLDNAGTRSYKEIDEKLGVMKQVELNAELILMMSAVVSKEGESISP